MALASCQPETRNFTSRPLRCRWEGKQMAKTKFAGEALTRVDECPRQTTGSVSSSTLLAFSIVQPFGC